MKRPYFKNVHTKKTQHADSSTALDRSQAADKEEREDGPASHRTREKLNMRKHVLDISGSTLVQCTNHDEGGNRRFASGSNARRKTKKSSASDKKTSNSVLPTRERHQMSDAALRGLARTALE